MSTPVTRARCLLLMLICALNIPAAPAFAADKTEQEIAADAKELNFSVDTLNRIKTLMEKPATWDKIPKEVKFCYFSIDSSPNGPTYKYAMKFMSESAKYKEIAKLGGIDMDLKFTPPYDMKIDLASPKLKRKATTFIHFKPYTDERIVTEDFKNGSCDGVAISNLRAKQFNSFVGSLDAVGGVPSYMHLTEAIKALSRGELGKLMVNKDYEVTGIFPLGAAYFMVNDRRITTPAKAAGKRMAVFDFDKSQAKMVQRMGVQPIAAEFSNFGGKFNNGLVDIIAGPAVMFAPLELHKGMDDANGNLKGGIVRFPLLQVTGVVMVHRKTFPDGLGQLMREYSSQQLDFAYDFINSIEKSVPAKYWMEVPAADKPGYIKLMREARIAMTKEGFYDKRMMSLLKHIRCKFEPSNYECTMADE